MKIAAIAFIVLLLLILLAEVALRVLFGFGDPSLYVADPEIGYLLAPNQKTRRFGNRIQINAYSMRADEISKEPDPASFRVFLLGDSIANGGWWTDQDDIISEQIEAKLEGDRASSVEVLNTSANSWGPRNELAYVQKFGTFGSQVVVLLINTDDLFATAPTSVQVGIDRNYRDRKPPLALIELLQLYLLPAPEIPGLAEVKSEGGDRVGKNLNAIADMKTIVTRSNAEFILAMTPLIREVGEPGSRDYEIAARQRVDEFVAANDINYIDFLPLFQATKSPEDLFRDNIHLSPKGNELVSDAIVNRLAKLGFRF